MDKTASASGRPSTSNPTIWRTLILPGLVLLVAEALVIFWPLDTLFHFSAPERAMLVSVGAPALAVAQGVWLACQAFWLAPIRRALVSRQSTHPLAPARSAACYYALGALPLRTLLVRTLLFAGAAVVIASVLFARRFWPAERAISFCSIVAAHAFVIGTLRAAWTARVTRLLRDALFPGVSPLRQLRDRYFRRILLVSLLTGAVAYAALCSFTWFFLPLRPGEFLRLQIVVPGLLAAFTLLWYAYGRRARRPIDEYLDGQLAGELRRVGPRADADAILAWRTAQLLPYRLAAAKLAAWVSASAVAALLGHQLFAVEVDNAVLLLGIATVIVVGAALYEALWHRDTLRALLLHVTSRHRMPVREGRTALSLRAKLLVSFGGVVLFACGLSLFWGFVQYKKLVERYAQRQAQSELDKVRSELVMRLTNAPTSERVASLLADLATGAPDDAVYYHVPAAGARTVGVAGGGGDAPRLPWYSALRLHGHRAGSLELTSLRLTGSYRRLEVPTARGPIDLGWVAVAVPNYRGRGPGVERPLLELVLFFLALSAVCGGIVLLTVQEFTAPIRQLEQRADEMARGELAGPVFAGVEGDEVGRLSLALEEMRRALRDKLRTTEEVNVDLEREVQRRTADLARKNRELAETLEKLTFAQRQLVHAEKMASIGQLVAGIAHEINNPVNAIVNTVGPLSDEIEQIASRAQDPAAAQELRDMARVIQRGARRTKDIVQALHNYSRSDDERVVEFDLNRSLDDSLELLRHQFRGVIEVDRRYGEVGRIRGHAGQLNQVFMNLLTNAAQALAGKEAARIVLTTTRSSERVEIAVADNGPGIPQEILPRIWDPFFTTKEVGQGSGLGLSIVHGIVERHGGTIGVVTRIGEGTTFTVSLPERPLV
ncbi:MAG: sensor histidine kinase [Myxococcales bacterium]|nr:sensor histidine kinase [Myxococcales bacterium]